MYIRLLGFHPDVIRNPEWRQCSDNAMIAGVALLKNLMPTDGIGFQANALPVFRTQ
jgi:hypothetical protein